MIELNDKTQQDFLNREWVQKLLDAGIDMSDARYYIAREQTYEGKDVIVTEVPSLSFTSYYCNITPTYTVLDLLNKLKNYEDCPILDTNVDIDTLIESLASLLIRCRDR